MNEKRGDGKQAAWSAALREINGELERVRENARASRPVAFDVPETCGPLTDVEIVRRKLLRLGVDEEGA
jgi:hypothetical protein